MEELVTEQSEDPVLGLVQLSAQRLALGPSVSLLSPSLIRATKLSSSRDMSKDCCEENTKQACGKDTKKGKL